ncbi:hypothetical protein AVEN_157543-1 [Araneus ventricosus]|uniref:Growth factor receptor domain-containing protein n=1 Tax=Araneus ventricosus TaxID=182803 RepID=A0A4Y2I5P9_ARAVE|nr:hypothetical protein AVEN_157543-1 [Araneus ventricosus]
MAEPSQSVTSDDLCNLRLFVKSIKFKIISACHDECQGCFGPLPFQCTSCPFGQFLLENSCVWDCGQGYFGDLGAGICGKCHPDCRACLGGPSKDKCLTCSRGYLLPYIGTHFGSCVDECPAGYYLTADGNCAGKWHLL